MKYDATQAHHANYYIKQPNTDNSPAMHVKLHLLAHPHLSCIHDVCPSEGEIFYLCALLQHRPASSYVDAWTVDGVELPTF